MAAECGLGVLILLLNENLGVGKHIGLEGFSVKPPLTKSKLFHLHEVFNQ